MHRKQLLQSLDFRAESGHYFLQVHLRNYSALEPCWLASKVTGPYEICLQFRLPVPKCKHGLPAILLADDSWLEHWVYKHLGRLLFTRPSWSYWHLCFPCDYQSIRWICPKFIVKWKLDSADWRRQVFWKSVYSQPYNFQEMWRFRNDHFWCWPKWEKIESQLLQAALCEQMHLDCL